jgi:hypothetical protein
LAFHRRRNAPAPSLTAEPEPQQKIRPKQRDVMAGGTIDLDEIASPEIVDPRQIEGCISTIIRAASGPRNQRPHQEIAGILCWRVHVWAR